MNTNSKILDKLKLLLLLVVAIGIPNCKNINNANFRLRTGDVFYNDTANKLWRHKVNTIEELQRYAKVFKGLELDLVYYPDSNHFYVEHDPNSGKYVKFIDYLAAIEQPDSFYYWLDIKNLKYEYIDQLAERLLYVLDKYDLRNKVICESWSVKPLKTLHELGLYTSYWIPSFSYDGNIIPEQQKKLDNIIKVLNDCPHNAISAPYQMLPFIEDHLSDCSVHLWTNGLKTKKDKEIIKAIAASPIVKVVLIDYEEPF